MAAAAGHAESPWRLTIQTDKPGARINPGFYGLMTEEINHSYDGGLYAELIQNRVFKDSETEPVHWLLVRDEGGVGSMALDKTNPVTPALDVSLKLEISSAGPMVGVANEGFCNYSAKPGGRVAAGPGGLPVLPDTTYKAAFFARSQGSVNSLIVRLQSSDGKKSFAETRVNGVGADWHRYNVELHTGGNLTPSLDNHLVIGTTQPGTLWLNSVSLFPPTYKNRPNGNRIDLSEKLAALHPTFLRFPGGNYLDPGHYEWKKTLGPVEQRPGRPGAWKYRSSDGLGLLEFFLWCEDLNMEPVLAVTDGRGWLPPAGDVAPLVQDALDEIQYATGDVSTPWGARRQADGHAAPFKLRYVEIGNEDLFDSRSVYASRFAKFFDAIRAAYPPIKVISTRRDVPGRVPDLIDDHIYTRPAAMGPAGAAYDTYSRTAPKIFVGEWATEDGIPTPTLRAALADAAYLTGLERNADVIEMACYAPLLTTVLPNGRQWPTNLIGYDGLTSFGSPSYYMQLMFSRNKGDVVLPASLTQTGASTLAPELPRGMVGIGTYEAYAEFKDAQVSAADGKVLYQSDFAQHDKEWRRQSGTWKSGAVVIAQTGDRQFARAATGNAQWTDYTYTVKARATQSGGGLLLYFHLADNGDCVCWNLGGWDDKMSGLEQTMAGVKRHISDPTDLPLETGRWYDIKIEVNGRGVRCYLDGKLVTEAAERVIPPSPPVYVSATREAVTGDVILKVVNQGQDSQSIQLDLAGATRVSPQAAAEVLAGDPDATNDMAEPTRIVPKPETIEDAAPTFDHEFPGHSVTVLRLRTER